MNFTQQKEMLEYDLYNSIVLDPIKIKCPSHPCVALKVTTVTVVISTCVSPA